MIVSSHRRNWNYPRYMHIYIYQNSWQQYIKLPHCRYVLQHGLLSLVSNLVWFWMILHAWADRGAPSTESENELRSGVIQKGGATFGYASLQASSGVPGPGGVMSCSDVMYQYYPYLYQTHRPPPPHPTHPHAAPHSHPHANPHAAHHSPARPAPFQPFPAATATHQYDRVSLWLLFRFIGLTPKAPLAFERGEM